MNKKEALREILCSLNLAVDVDSLDLSPAELKFYEDRLSGIKTKGSMTNGEEVVEEILALFKSGSSETDEELRNLLRPIIEVVMFLQLSLVMFDRVDMDDKRIIKSIGTVAKMLHTLHCDKEDHAESRRSMPSVLKAFSDEFVKPGAFDAGVEEAIDGYLRINRT